MVAGFPLESILTAVLGALSSPSLSFIGVSYDSSISLQAGQSIDVLIVVCAIDLCVLSQH